ncbi:Vps54-domain-containing protein, partial [Meira miltonrushii]
MTSSSAGGSQANGSSRSRQYGETRESIQSPSRVLSPALSDADSSTSSTATGRRDSVNTSRKLGNLQGAGLSSLSLALGADHGYTAGSSLVGFNAISTLLNNPNKVSRPIDPSSSRYPSISQSHTDIPKVKRSDYESTINSLKSEWDRYQRNQKLGIRGDVSVIDDAPSTTKGRQSVDDEEVSRRALGKKRLPPLSTVPQVFFSEEFDLGNPYTFDLVTERYKAASSTSSGNASRNGSIATGYDVALNQMLQEKLSYYSDVVEQHLILEISARSSSFFAALGNLKDLEAESRSCLDKVEELRRELDDRDEGIAKAGLSLIREQAKRRETVERLEAVGLMNQLCEKRDLCQLLVQNNEWSEALDVMQDLQNVIQGKTKLLPRPTDGAQNNSAIPPHVEIEFENVVAVQALGPQLEEMQNNISSQLEVELLNILLTDLTDRVGKPVEDTAAKPSNIDPSALSKRIEAHIGGLVRTGGMDRLMTAYKDAILREARKIMRTFLCDAQLPSLNGSTNEKPEWLNHLATLIEDDEAAQGKADAKLGPGGLEAAQKLQNMEHTQFLGLLRTLLRGLTAFVSGVDSQRRVLVHILDKQARSKDNESSTGTNGEAQIEIVMPNGVSPSLPNTLTGIITEACSATHILASRFLSLRSLTHTVLPLRQFLGVFHLAWTFILESEGICGRMIVGLRGVVLNQAKAWLGNFHKVRIEKAAKAVEEEQWGQADVLPRQQSEITLVIESATSDPPSFVVGKESIQGEASAEKESGENKDSEPKMKSVTIEDKQFFVVSASLDVLDMLVEYLQVIINLPLLSTEIMGRVVEFLKQFNSRTCQVVLGAGAMRSAGLKNITAKHLALASQSLSIMILLIPYIREAVRRHLNARQAVMLVEFDKLKRDYQEHQFEIHSKLVAIMSDRLTVHCRSLSSIEWAASIEGDGPVGAVKPMMDLVKETTTLHKVLCKYLQPSVVEAVIGQVLVSIDKRIAAEFRKIETHDENSTKRVKAVRDHFNEKFGTLKHV